MDATLAAWLPCAPPSLRGGVGCVPSLRGALGVGPSLRGLPILTVLRRVPRGAIGLSGTSANGLSMGHGQGDGQGHGNRWDNGLIYRQYSK